ncbi:hypothetical protein [Nocardia jejuensis]|uniref:hypothetical protein n=1 Tax=Nocardia jejuensis TaxID=328049 RepID=UPI00082CFE38|nr:hypothetical protein [Nocardia jejuensis]
MSQHIATTAARSSWRATQVLRYSAVVTASMASIGLTVAAGSYIANEMAQQPGKLNTAAPAVHPPIDIAGGSAVAPHAGDITSGIETSGRTPLFAVWPAPAASPAAKPADRVGTPQRPSPIAGQLRLGSTYLGAQVVPAQRNSVSFMVDTNIFATIADFMLHTPVGESLGIASDPLANTQLRTDVDPRGEITLTLSDPGIGRYGVQFVRHSAPGAADPDTTPRASESTADTETATGDTEAGLAVGSEANADAGLDVNPEAGLAASPEAALAVGQHSGDAEPFAGARGESAGATAV